MANMTFGVNLIPKNSNNTQQTLGNSENKWDIYANKINGEDPVTLSNTSVISYTGNEKVPLRLGNNNVYTDLNSLSSYFGGSGSGQNVSLTNYTLQINNISSLPYTNSTIDNNITSKMVVLESTLSNLAAQTGDWTITTTDGYVTIEGSISGTTNLTLVMGVSNTTAPTIQTNLSSNAAVNLLQDNPKPGVTGVLPLGYGGTGVSATDNADLLSKLGAVNTTIYERLNYVTVPANTSQTLVTRILQPGTWLILSYMTLQDSLSGNSFNNTINVITPTNDYLVGDTVRGDGAGGGGTVCFAVTTIPDSGTYTLTLSTYVGGHQTSVRCCYALIKLM